MRVIVIQNECSWSLCLYLDEDPLLPQFLNLSSFLRPMVSKYVSLVRHERNFFILTIEGDMNPTNPNPNSIAPESQEIHPFWILEL